MFDRIKRKRINTCSNPPVEAARESDDSRGRDCNSTSGGACETTIHGCPEFRDPTAPVLFRMAPSGAIVGITSADLKRPGT